MLQPLGPPDMRSCSAADVEASDEYLCASSGPDRKLAGGLAAVGGPVTRVSCCESSLMGTHAAELAAAHEQTLGEQLLLLLCPIG